MVSFREYETEKRLDESRQAINNLNHARAASMQANDLRSVGLARTNASKQVELYVEQMYWFKEQYS